MIPTMVSAINDITAVNKIVRAAINGISSLSNFIVDPPFGLNSCAALFASPFLFNLPATFITDLPFPCG